MVDERASNDILITEVVCVQLIVCITLGIHRVPEGVVVVAEVVVVKTSGKTNTGRIVGRQRHCLVHPVSCAPKTVHKPQHSSPSPTRRRH